ncbi:MAG: thermonuclease family protein [Bacteroidota bacterium]|nr:thermonuclease family protein [Bacteroidota bacterium]
MRVKGKHGAWGIGERGNPFRRHISLITLAALLCSSGCETPREEILVGRVVGIRDGDTIELLVDGKTERIRLAGIDCPEKAQPYSVQAKAFTASLCFDSTVLARVCDTDHYGRRVCIVTLGDGRILNRELVSAGYAWHYRQYSSDPLLDRLEQQARAERRGLWSEPNPIPPWEFRKRARTDSTAHVRSFH